jgi:NAD(P)H-dependent FMN reductase
LTFLAISGSLRAASSNATLLGAAARLAPEGVEIVLDSSLGQLRHFDPDLDGEGAVPPEPVQHFRTRLREADAVLISSPEYIHGVPGSIKNALDWTASSGVLVDKPVALINASATSTHAQISLVETLTVLMAKVSATRIPMRSNRLDLDDVLADESIAKALRSVTESLVNAVLARA